MHGGSKKAFPFNPCLLAPPASCCGPFVSAPPPPVGYASPPPRRSCREVFLRFLYPGDFYCPPHLACPCLPGLRSPARFLASRPAPSVILAHCPHVTLMLELLGHCRGRGHPGSPSRAPRVGLRVVLHPAAGARDETRRRHPPPRSLRRQSSTTGRASTEAADQI